MLEYISRKPFVTWLCISLTHWINILAHNNLILFICSVCVSPRCLWRSVSLWFRHCSEAFRHHDSHTHNTNFTMVPNFLFLFFLYFFFEKTAYRTLVWLSRLKEVWEFTFQSLFLRDVVGRVLLMLLSMDMKSSILFCLLQMSTQENKPLQG